MTFINRAEQTVLAVLITAAGLLTAWGIVVQRVGQAIDRAVTWR